VLTLDVPLSAELDRDWRFVAALPSGGMVVQAALAEQLLLLDRELRVSATLRWPELPSDSEVAVCERTGRVALHAETALEVFELSGRRIHRLEHGDLTPAAPCAWSADGALLWTIVPGAEPEAVHVVVIETATWTVVGRRRLAADCRTYTSSFVVLADPVEPVAALQAVLCNLDGVHTAYLRLADGQLSPIFGSDEPDEDDESADEELLADVRPSGGEFLTVDIGERAVGVVGFRPLDQARWLEWSELAGPKPTGSGLAEVDEGRWDGNGVGYLDDDFLITQTADSQVLVLRREPLQLVAQVDLEGYDFEPFTGWDIYRPGASSRRRPLSWFAVCGPGRIVTSDNRIYDIGVHLHR